MGDAEPVDVVVSEVAFLLDERDGGPGHPQVGGEEGGVVLEYADELVDAVVKVGETELDPNDERSGVEDSRAVAHDEEVHLEQGEVEGLEFGGTRIFGTLQVRILGSRATTMAMRGWESSSTVARKASTSPSHLGEACTGRACPGLHQLT